MRENTTTDPTMLSAKNFPREEEGVLRKRTRFLMPVDSYSSNNSPKVLMSSLSMKSHNRSITSWTCFMHFPCWKMIRQCQISHYLQFLSRGTEANQPTHALVAEAHGAGFAFAEEEKIAIAQDERSAGAIFSPAAHFTGVLRLCKELTWLVQNVDNLDVKPSLFYRCKHRTEGSAWPRRKGCTPRCDNGRCRHRLCCPRRWKGEDSDCCCLTCNRQQCQFINKASSSAMLEFLLKGAHLCRMTCLYR